MFLLKKLISTFLMPLPVAFLLLGTGLALLWFSKRQRAGKVVTSVGFAVFCLAGWEGLAEIWLGPLERRHEPLYPAQKVAQLSPAPRWVVVLGSGHTHDPKVPPSGQLSAAALTRLAEGIRLQRELPGSKLLVSGGPGHAQRHGDVLAAAARLLGVPSQDVVADTTGWDTEDEAKAVARRLGQQPFVLVTSAYHMPRAVGLFRKQGLQPIPAPTEHRTLDDPGVGFRALFPSSAGLHESTLAAHEYIGILWAKLRGRM